MIFKRKRKSKCVGCLAFSNPHGEPQCLMGYSLSPDTEPPVDCERPATHTALTVLLLARAINNAVKEDVDESG